MGEKCKLCKNYDPVSKHEMARVTEQEIVNQLESYKDRHRCSCSKCGDIHSPPPTRVHVSVEASKALHNTLSDFKPNIRGMTRNPVGFIYGLSVFEETDLTYPVVKVV